MDEISFILHFVSFSFHLLRIYEDFNCFDVTMYDDVYICNNNFNNNYNYIYNNCKTVVH